MAMPQCCYLAKIAKRPSQTTNTIKFDRIPFDPCNSIKRFDLCPFDQKNSTYLQQPLFTWLSLLALVHCAELLILSPTKLKKYLFAAAFRYQGLASTIKPSTVIKFFKTFLLEDLSVKLTILFGTTL